MNIETRFWVGQLPSSDSTSHIVVLVGNAVSCGSGDRLAASSVANAEN